MGETADGSCPIFAATDATPGNPYGVIGDWDVSAVTSMEQSKCTRVLSLCWPRRLPLWCVVEYIRQLEVLRVTISLTRFFFFLWFETVPFVVVFVWWVWSFFFFVASVLWCICVQFRRVEMEYRGGDKYGIQ